MPRAKTDQQLVGLRDELVAARISLAMLEEKGAAGGDIATAQMTVSALRGRIATRSKKS